MANLESLTLIIPSDRAILKDGHSAGHSFPVGIYGQQNPKLPFLIDIEIHAALTERLHITLDRREAMDWYRFLGRSIRSEP